MYILFGNGSIYDEWMKEVDKELLSGIKAQVIILDSLSYFDEFMIKEERHDEPNPKNKVYGPLKARQQVISKRIPIPTKPKFNPSIRASMRSVNRNR